MRDVPQDPRVSRHLNHTAIHAVRSQGPEEHRKGGHTSWGQGAMENIQLDGTFWLQPEG
jgi:hypothetical protein